MARLPAAHDRLSLARDDQVACALTTPYRDGTTHIVLEQLDLMVRLAAPGSAPAPGFRLVGQAEEKGELPQFDLDPIRL